MVQFCATNVKCLLQCGRSKHWLLKNSCICKLFKDTQGFFTWQPRAALRKLRTEGDMGAAPVTMNLTRPPRDSCGSRFRECRSTDTTQTPQTTCVCSDRTSTWTLLKMSLSQMLFFLTMPSFISAYFLSTAKFSSHFLNGVVAPLWTWWENMNRWTFIVSSLFLKSWSSLKTRRQTLS